MSPLEARKTAVFFIQDFFDKRYGALNETVRFHFRNLISGALPSVVVPSICREDCLLSNFTKLQTSERKFTIAASSNYNFSSVIKNVPIRITKANIWSYLLN